MRNNRTSSHNGPIKNYFIYLSITINELLQKPKIVAKKILILVYLYGAEEIKKEQK
jgi:hypothetical protein